MNTLMSMRAAAIFLTMTFVVSRLCADSSLLQQAQSAWSQREKPEETERAIGLWQKALKEDPSQSNVLIDLTKACARMYRQSKEDKEKTHWVELARTYGAEAIAKNPGSSDAYAEYAAALGQWAQEHKGIHSVKVVRQSIDMMKKSIDLNPRNPTPHMLLAEMYRQAPHWISKGDKQKALEQARLAAQYGGAYALNHVVLAKSLLDTGHKEEAIHELQTAVQLKAPIDAVPETKSDQEEAREMLKKLGASTAATPGTESPLAENSCDKTEGICKDPAMQGAP